MYTVCTCCFVSEMPPTPVVLFDLDLATSAVVQVELSRLKGFHGSCLRERLLR